MSEETSASKLPPTPKTPVVAAAQPNLTDQQAIDHVLQNWCSFNGPDHGVRQAFIQNRITSMNEVMLLIDSDISNFTPTIPKVVGTCTDKNLPIPSVKQNKIKQMIILAIKLLQKYYGFDPNNSWRDYFTPNEFHRHIADLVNASRKMIESSPTVPGTPMPHTPLVLRPPITCI
jgi:hypothetical protein